MKVVAISGWKRSGKDTVGEYLKRTYGFSRVAFADPLKDMAAKEYGFPRDHADDPAFKEAPILHQPVSPKDAFSLNLIRFMYKEFRSADGRTPMELVEDASGTVLGLMSYRQVFGASDVAQLYWTPRALCILKGSTNRAVDSNYWVQTAINQIKTESAKIHLSDNYLITDLRYKNEMNQLRQAFGKNLLTIRVNRFDNCESTDPSERDLDDGKFDVVLENRGTLEELFNKVEDVNGLKS